MHSDIDIIESLKKGGRNAQEEVVARYMLQIRNFIAAIVQDTRDAEELTQDTFLALFQSASRYDITKSTLAALIYRIAYNKAQNFLRRNKIAVSPYDEKSVESVAAYDYLTDDESREAKETREQELAQLVNTLSSQDQTIIMLYYYDNRKVSDIAFIMNTTSRAIYNRLDRIRNKLRVQLMSDRKK